MQENLSTTIKAREKPQLITTTIRINKKLKILWHGEINARTITKTISLNTLRFLNKKNRQIKYIKTSTIN
jgi:hypothetical protein